MLTYSSYTDFLFSSARPLLYTSASRHHLFSSLLMQHHLFFLCSLRSRAAPCSPHPAQSTCRGWELWWKPCRRQRRPAAPVHPTTSCIPHTQIYTLSYTEHTVLHTYILPLPQLQCTTTKSLYSWWSCLWCCENHTHKHVTEISVVIFNLCESTLNNVRILLYFSNYLSSSIWLIESLTHMQTPSVSFIHTLSKTYICTLCIC